MDRSFAGRPRNITLQERALSEAQKKLDRIDRMRDEMAKQVELEQKRLEEMRQVAEDFTTGTQPVTNPSLSSATPASFQSQYDQHSSTLSNERLKTGADGEGIVSAVIDKAQESLGVKPPTSNQSFYRTSDRDEHWIALATDPGKAVFVSGYYYSSGETTKRYEYILGSTQLPISVGDMVQAPVHSSGHGDGRFLRGHDRRFIVTDIYSKNKFQPYHDVIW